MYSTSLNVLNAALHRNTFAVRDGSHTKLDGKIYLPTFTISSLDASYKYCVYYKIDTLKIVLLSLTLFNYHVT